MKLELVSKTVGVNKYQKLDSEELVAAIARHGVIKEDNGKLVRYLLNNKHFSPLDMINFSFEIETSRDIGRQILRHQSIKFQEHSTRYSDRVLFEDISLRLEHPTNRQSSIDTVCIVSHKEKTTNSIATFDFGNTSRVVDDFYSGYGNKVYKLLEETENLYKEGIELGLAKECLRKFLPGCLTTTMSANGTLRSWLAFLNVRCDHHAEKEIQLIAQEIGEILEKEMPNVFSTINWREGMFM